MKEKNTTDAPTWFINRNNAFLAALHVMVLALSLVAHPPIGIGTDRALP